MKKMKKESNGQKFTNDITELINKYSTKLTCLDVIAVLELAKLEIYTQTRIEESK